MKTFYNLLLNFYAVDPLPRPSNIWKIFCRRNPSTLIGVEYWSKQRFPNISTLARTIVKTWGRELNFRVSCATMGHFWTFTMRIFKRVTNENYKYLFGFYFFRNCIYIVKFFMWIIESVHAPSEYLTRSVF